MKRKVVSVIMTVYNETELELKKSFESVLNQTYNNLEIIIIIDNPKEKWREEFIRNYNDKRVKLYVNKKNIGLPLSLNKALKYVTGDYIARMDADDVSISDRIEKQLEYLEKNDYDLVGSNVQYYYNGRPQKIVRFPSKPQNIDKFLKYKSASLHPTWFAKPIVFKELNGYRNIFAVEDYDFLLRASLKGFKLSNLQDVLYEVSLSENSISRSNSGRQEMIAEFLKKAYKKKKIISEEKIGEFINSKEFSKKLKSYNFYCFMKDKRARYRNKKFPMYYIYSLMLGLNLKHSFKEFYKKILCKIILINDKI